MQLLSWLSVVLAIISLAIQLYDHRRPQPTLSSGAERHWGFVVRLELLGYQLKTGHTLSVQNRPTGLAEDVIVLPCRSMRLQGLGLSPRSVV